MAVAAHRLGRRWRLLQEVRDAERQIRGALAGLRSRQFLRHPVLLRGGAAQRAGVRTALTVDMWEALNDSWNHLRNLAPDATEGEQLPNFLGWVQERVTLFNGAAHDTMLRDEPWRFVHLGTMLERADNTARLLDVKHELFARGRGGRGRLRPVAGGAALGLGAAVLPVGLSTKGSARGGSPS